MLLHLNLSRLSDERLMADGSERAFAELYNRYARRLQGFLLRQLGGDRELAADFCHDAFMRIYDARRSYNADRPFRTWIFTIAYNLCKNRYRHLQVEAEAMAQIDRLPEAEQPTVEAELTQQELDAALRHVLDALPAEARMLFALRFEEDLSVAETAAVMQLPEGTVKSRQHKIMNHIRQQLSRMLQ